MTELSAPDRPLRADAERNRVKILAAAREVFADRGFVASLDDIAAHAGVGVGTVYRRFPDKDALIEALFEERLGDIAEIGRRALAAKDPWDGFISFMTEGIALQAKDRGLKQAMHARGGDRVQRARATIMPIAGELIARAQRTGALRADLDLTDVPLINMMISAIADLTRDVSPEVYRRMLQLVFDGLVTRRSMPTPLPADAIKHAELAAAIAKHGFP
jgi:AcrR family transcriptional regulator